MTKQDYKVLAEAHGLVLQILMKRLKRDNPSFSHEKFLGKVVEHACESHRPELCHTEEKVK